MKHILFILFLFCGSALYGQINPKNFPVETTIRDSIAFYTNEAGAGYDESKKVYIKDLKDSIINEAGNQVGIYSGDGTAPADVDVTVTDNIDFDAGTLYIDGASNEIGIGTTSPQRTLQVDGSARIGDSAMSTGTGITDKELSIVTDVDTSGLALHRNGGVGNDVGINFMVDNAAAASKNFGGWFGFEKTTTAGRGNFIWALKSGATTPINVDPNTEALMTLEYSGDLGIGISAPALDIHVHRDDVATQGNYMHFTSETTGELITDGFSIGLRPNGNALFVMREAAELGFATNNTDRMTIQSDGDVGIGTTSPTELLDVNSDAIRIRSSQTPASASATGTTGMIAWDSNYIYVCVATNTWVRAALSTW